MRIISALLCVVLISCAHQKNDRLSPPIIQAHFNQWRSENNCTSAICLAEISSWGSDYTFIGISLAEVEPHILVGNGSDTQAFQSVELNNHSSDLDRFKEKIVNFSKTLKTIELNRVAFLGKNALTHVDDGTDYLIVIKVGPNLDVYQRMGWAQTYTERKFMDVFSKMQALAGPVETWGN